VAYMVLVFGVRDRFLCVKCLCLEIKFLAEYNTDSKLNFNVARILSCRFKSLNVTRGV
jgi:hypothetical protein